MNCPYPDGVGDDGVEGHPSCEAFGWDEAHKGCRSVPGDRRAAGNSAPGIDSPADKQEVRAGGNAAWAGGGAAVKSVVGEGDHPAASESSGEAIVEAFDGIAFCLFVSY